MGWGSGVDIFDGALDVFLDFVPEGLRVAAVKKFYVDAFKHQDWDTQQESNYFEPYLKQAMIELGELDVCPTCHGIQYYEYKGEWFCENDQCPDSKYFDGKN